MAYKSDEEFYAELKEHPDFLKFPLPETWYAKFNIPRPTAQDFKTFLLSGYTMKCRNDPNTIREIRKDPAPGGVRPILPAPEIPIEVVTRQIVDESQQEMPQLSEDSTGSSDSKRQQSSDSSTSHEQNAS